MTKSAEVTPVFKSGIPTEPSNYRPISILPVVSKVLEKAVHKSLLEFLENEKLLNNH